MATADIVIEGKDSSTQLLVEAKTKSPATTEWATQLRRNLSAHQSLPNAPFFLLALPERFYLWKNAKPGEPVYPQFEIDANQTLHPYLEKVKTPLTSMSRISFEILVRTWLDDVMTRQTAPADKWLLDSGLYEAIKQGSIRHEKRP